MQGGLPNFQEGTPVIGFQQNETLAQLWSMQEDSKDEYTLVNAAGGAFARAPDHSLNAEVIGSKTSEIFKVKGTNGKYQIAIIPEGYTFWLPNGDNKTRVQLKVANKSDNNQLWYLENA